MRRVLTQIFKSGSHEEPVSTASQTEGGTPQMEDEQNEELEAGKENGNGDGVLELTRTELDEMMARVVKEATEPLKQDLEAARSDLDAQRSSTHEAHIREVVRDLQDEGHSAAVCTRVAEIMLADVGGAELTLSRREDDGSTSEAKHTVSELILSLLELTRKEDLELAKRQPESKDRQRPPARKDDKPLDEKAEEILKDIRARAVMISSL